MSEDIGMYKKLLVWQKAMCFAESVYGFVKELPANERFALSDQLRRAAVSVPSNIAEGSGRVGNRDYAHFLSISRGSLYETMTQIELAKNLVLSVPIQMNSSVLPVNSARCLQP